MKRFLFLLLFFSLLFPVRAQYMGDFSENASVSFSWDTFAGDGASITRSGDGLLWVWKDMDTTSTAGITNTEDFNGMTGAHKCVIDLSSDAFYATGSDYTVKLRDATIDGKAVNATIREFSIENRFMRGTDSSVSGEAKRPATAYVLSVGTQSANTFASTEELDGVRHEHTDTAGSMDLYYEFDIGSGTPKEIKLTGYLQGSNDDLEVYGYDWVSSSWKQIGVMTGLNSSVNVARTYDLLFNMVGSNADEGKVRFRLTDGAFTLTSALLAIDQILVEFSQGVEGYQNAAVWLDTSASNTNTVRGVDGTATNPVSTIAAANTLLASTNLKSIEVAPNSSITFAASQENQKFVGRNWTLALGGQSISGSFIEGANVTGIATGATAPHFDHCHFGNVTIPPSDNESCVLQGTFTLGSAGNYFFEDCKSGVAGTNTPILDFGVGLAASSINMRSWSGGIELQNMGAGAGAYNMSLEGWGQLVIAASCSADSTVAIRGSFTVTDNAGGAVTLSDDARYDVAQINAEADTALADYDGPTNTEMDAAHALLATLAAQIVIDGNVDAIKTVTDLLPDSGALTTIGTDSGRLTAVRAATMTDWIDGGRLDLILDAVPTGNLESNSLNGFYIKNVESFVHFSMKDINGDLLSGTSPACALFFSDPLGESIGFTACTNSPVEASVSGWFRITLTAAEMDYDTITFRATAASAVDFNVTLRTVAATEAMRGTDNAATANSLSTVAGNVDTILVDTGTSIPDTLTLMSGATFSQATDSLEAIRNRGDAAWATGGGGDATASNQTAILAQLTNMSGTGFTSPTHSLVAIRVRGDGFWITGGAGTGTTSHTITVTDAALLPIADVLIEVFTEESMQNKVVTGRTDNFGLVTFFLNPGSYYSRATKSGYSFVNPQTEVVE